MRALERLRGLRVVADPAALDTARWSGDRTPTGAAVGEVVVLRFAPDEAFAIGARHVNVDDDHAVVDEERGFVGAWCSLAEFGEHIEPHIEWSFGDVGSLGQGSIAGVPAKLLLTADDKVLLLTAAPYADELAERLGLRP